jgi:large subunit ribosomal protein L10
VNRARTEKQQTVAALSEALSSAALLVVVHQTGLVAAESTDLRRKMREGGASIKVVKNTLARIALKGTPFEGREDLLKGPTAIGYSTDPVAAAKVLSDFAKKNEKVKILGGALGSQMLDAAGIDALAKLPSLDQLRAKLLGVIQAPASKLAAVTQAPASKLARVFKAYADKDQDAA